ncbi:hypothetical protein BGZ76_000886 [Entomortierella beljakovae]|nr:hypothetical protein BGZ76_000886 [Entomortierella beljakovae]
MKVTTTYTLSNGVVMPSVGLGTYRVRDQDVLDACILQALRSGYRLIDTAAVYRNEVAIGNSLKRILEENLVPGLTRQDVFLTSKLAVLESLQNLQVDYIDLYLIHWPGTARLKGPNPRNAINRLESWRALEDLYHEGKLRAIGVSNFTVGHLNQLIGYLPQHNHTQPQTQPQELARTLVVPHVHQFELHPRLFQRDLVQFCQHHKIQVQAYSSLGEGRLVSLTPPPPPEMDAHYNKSPMPGALDVMPDLIRKYFDDPGNINNIDNQQDTSGIKDPELSKAMDVDVENFVVTESDESRKKNYAKRAAQILLRWGLQHGVVVIPKSIHPERINDNINLFQFEIDPEDMSTLDAYSTQGEMTRYCWDPSDIC